jgi:hypothetical protein
MGRRMGMDMGLTEKGKGKGDAAGTIGDVSHSQCCEVRTRLFLCWKESELKHTSITPSLLTSTFHLQTRQFMIVLEGGERQEMQPILVHFSLYIFVQTPATSDQRSSQSQTHCSFSHYLSISAQKIVLFKSTIFLYCHCSASQAFSPKSWLLAARIHSHHAYTQHKHS